MTREELHNFIATYNGNKLLLEVATGYGKTLAAILLVEKLGGSWNIVVAETAHINTWKAEFTKHGKEHLLKSVNIFCYQSLHKHKDGNNYIYDECHRLTTQKRLSLVRTIKHNYAVMLSATVTTYQKTQLKYSIGEFDIVKITLSEAIEAKVLPEPMVYFIGFNLDDNVRIHKYSFTKDKSIAVTEQEWYNRQSAYINVLKQRFEQSYAQSDKLRWLTAANKRKKFLADVKTKYARIILRELQNRRLLCFASSIPQSELLGAGFTIHSHNSSKLNDKRFEDFNNLVTNKLFAVGKLKEGVNLTQLDCAVVIQLDNSVRYYTQILGRSMRSDSPILYVLYIKNSRDEEYTKTVLEDFNMEYVKFINLREFYEQIT